MRKVICEALSTSITIYKMGWHRIFAAHFRSGIDLPMIPGNPSDGVKKISSWTICRVIMVHFDQVLIIYDNSH